MNFLFVVPELSGLTTALQESCMNQWIRPLSALAYLQTNKKIKIRCVSINDLKAKPEHYASQNEFMVFFHKFAEPGISFEYLLPWRAANPKLLTIAHFEAGISLPIITSQTFEGIDLVSDSFLEKGLGHLALGYPAEKIPEFYIRQKHKRVSIATACHYDVDFEEMPPPAWEKLNIPKGATLPVEITREIASSCLLCDSNGKKKILRRPVDWIVNQAIHLQAQFDLKKLHLVGNFDGADEDWKDELRHEFKKLADSLEVLITAKGQTENLFQVPAALQGRAGRQTKSTKKSILWGAPLFDPTGNAEDARNLILAADNAGITVRAVEYRGAHKDLQLDGKTESKLRKLQGTNLSGDLFTVWHTYPAYFSKAEGAARNIGRTTFETDRIPEVWVAKCNEMDEIWVPSSFNVESFVRSGVDLEKLRVLPQALNEEIFGKLPQPLPFRDGLGFVFLSSFAWQYRKGWDLLLTAYCREFKSHENVTLVLKTNHPTKSLEAIQAEVSDFVRNRLHMDPAQAPRVIFLDEAIPSDIMPRLYRSADVFVLPTRAEGWCRSFMEAMACGVPVIGTRFGGHLDYMHDGNSFLIDCAIVPVSEQGIEENPIFRTHSWAEPIVDHIAELMRKAFVDHSGIQKIGERARAEILGAYTQEKIGEWLHSMIWEPTSMNVLSFNLGNVSNEAKRLEQKPSKGKAANLRNKQDRVERKLCLEWSGPWYVRNTTARINLEIVSRLIEDANLELSLHPTQDNTFAPEDERKQYKNIAARIAAPLSTAPDCFVTHVPQPSLQPPEKGHWIWMQPLAYGSLPLAWTKIVREKVDEVWAANSYVRKLYIEAGVSPDRVVVMPVGVDPTVYNPEAYPFDLPTNKKFKFLFLGGTDWVKGSDVLLTAFNTAFSSRDEVCLVIKEAIDGTFNDNNSARDMLHRMQDTPGCPEVIYIDKELSEKEMAGLYSTCDCLVTPYRGESYNIHVLEAMATQKPVIVTVGGPTEDFCNINNAYLIPARRRQLLDKDLETVGMPWVLEPDATALARKLREVFADVEGRKARAKNGHNLVKEFFTWDKVVEKVKERLCVVSGKPILRQIEFGKKEQSIALFHFSEFMPTQSAQIHAYPVAKGEDQSFGEAIALARATPSSEKWHAFVSSGFNPKQGWEDIILQYLGEENPILCRQENGVFLCVPQEFLQHITFESHFASGAVLLEAVRQLEEQEYHIKEIQEPFLCFDFADAKFVVEAKAITLLVKARKMIKQNRLEEAIEHLQNAIELKSDYEHAIFALGDLFLSLGDNQKAEQSARQLIALDPERIYGPELLSRCYYESGQWDKAEEVLEKSINSDPANYAALNDLAVIQWRRGQIDLAAANFRKIVHGDPTHIDAVMNLVRILELAGNNEEAASILERYLEYSPFDEEAKQKLSQLR